MNARARFVLALACLTTPACAGPRDSITLLDHPAHEADFAPDYQGCVTRFGTLGLDRPFAVGTRVEVAAGRERECIDYDVWAGCRAYAPEPRERLRSTDTSILVQESAGIWAFLAPGEVSLVLEIDGVDTTQITVRAEEPASLETFLVAQPALTPGDGSSDVAVPPTLVPADGAAVLRDGVGVGVLVLARDAGGALLCGQPTIELGLGEGLSRPRGSSAPRIGRPFVVTADAEAPSEATFELRARSASTSTRLALVAPAELTELRLEELREHASPFHFMHVVEATVRADARVVHGASIEQVGPDTGACDEASVYAAPVGTRFHAYRPCGDESDATLEVGVLEAPALRASVRLQR
jgi:hypothetical protein